MSYLRLQGIFLALKHFYYSISSRPFPTRFIPREFYLGKKLIIWSLYRNLIMKS